MKKWSVYAPVLIPTLCRYEHFKRCIDSLSRCTGAEYTEVYIGLDFPSKEEHWDGYHKIEKYLGSVSGFYNLVVIKREHNFGALENIRDLKKIVSTKYDRFITSEDDNEFSPNFLEYMNTGLEKYKDNTSVLRICGCLMPWDADVETCLQTYPFNAFPAMDYNALGLGGWFSKNYRLPFTKESILKSYKLTYKTFQYGYCLAIDRFLCQLHKESQLPDVCARLFCAFNNKYCIFPRISKVKNWGYDGSGLNSDNNPHWIDVVSLDTSPTFEMDEFEIKEYDEVKTFIRQMYDKPKNYSHVRTRVMIKYLFYRFTGYRIQDFSVIKKIHVFLYNFIH